MTLGSGDRAREEGCHGGGVYSCFPGMRDPPPKTPRFRTSPLKNRTQKQTECKRKLFRNAALGVGRPQSADKMFVRARDPRNWNPEVFDQTRCSRTFASRIRPEQQPERIGQAEVFVKGVLKQMTY